MGFFDGLVLQAVKTSPFRLTPRNSPFRGFLLPANGLCKLPKVHRNAQECIKRQKSLPEPCRGLGVLRGLEDHRKCMAQTGTAT